MIVLTVVGARPQFIKAAPVSRVLRTAGHSEILVHTGQHYDDEMSRVFFDELDLPEPDVNLGVGSGSHGAQTGRALELLDDLIAKERPDWVLVYGDTNSTLAGALAAAKLGFPVAHVEAGLRSFDRSMPEEINRVLTDHLADLLLCPSHNAVDQLKSEGINEGVMACGDVMQDAFAHDRALSEQKSTVLQRLELRSGGYTLMTLHRPANVDYPESLDARIHQISSVDRIFVWPVHPRAAPALERIGKLPDNIRTIAPTGRLDTIKLLIYAEGLVTDSGGLQKEAYWGGVPCFTLREETEWVETVNLGWNTLISKDVGALNDSIVTWVAPPGRPPLYGDGMAAEKIVSALGR